MKNPVCVNCGKSDHETALLTMQYQGTQLNICPQCLPILIHKPANLADKLQGAENFGPPAEHGH